MFSFSYDEKYYVLKIIVYINNVFFQLYVYLDIDIVLVQIFDLYI